VATTISTLWTALAPLRVLPGFILNLAICISDKQTAKVEWHPGELYHRVGFSYVAEMLGEDEDWLHELSIDMFPEDGCLRVYGIGKDGVPAFTDYGTESLKQIIAHKTVDAIRSANSS